MSSRSCLALGAATAALWCVPAQGEVVQCLARGPCKQADSIELLLGPAPSDPVVASNFGLLYPSAGGGGWQFACDDNFAGANVLKARIDDAGRIFVPSLSGLYTSGDGCGWTRAPGTVNDRIWDVVLD